METVMGPWTRPPELLEAREAETPLVVLLIDMQEHFVKEVDPGVRRRLLRAQASLIRDCVRLDVPLVVVTYDKCGPLIPFLGAHVDAVPRVVFDQKFSKCGFTSGNLEHVLVKMFGAKRVVLSGVFASQCVRATAQSAQRKGITVVTAENVVADSVWTSSHDPQLLELRACAQVHPILPSLEEVLG